VTRIFLSSLLLIVFASVASAHGVYRIQAGDVLRIEVLEDESLNGEALVLPDGSITVPLVGTISAGGKSIDAVRESIIAGLAPNFATAPNVFLSVRSLNTPTPDLTDGFGRAAIDVFVIGAVNSPGKVRITAGTTLLQFLSESGGLTSFAAKKRIQVRRSNKNTGQTAVYEFNYKAVEDGSSNARSMVLHRGDVIVVPERRLFE